MGRTLLDPLRVLANRAPVSFAPPGMRRSFGGTLFGGNRGAEAQMRAMGSNPTLFAIVDRTCTSYSQVPWKLYRKARSGLTQDRKEVTAHAALDLWNKPNPFMTGPAFRETAQQHEELTGEQPWLVSRDPRFDIPLELWPVRPDRIDPIPSSTDFLAGFEYHGPAGETVPLGLDEVIRLMRPNPLDPYRGLGPVQTVMVDLDSSRYSREWNRRFFLNSAEPGGILQVDKRLSDAEFDEHRERWAEQHRGVSAAHKVALLENGIQWIDRKYTNRDMQFAELALASRETIREAFGFPKPMLGAVDDVNRANAEAAEVVFARWLLVPRLERTKAALNFQLLPMYGKGAVDLEFDYVSPVPEDLDAEAARLTSRADAAATLREAGWNADEVLTTVGLPPMRWSAPTPTAVPTDVPPAASWDQAMAGLTGATAATTTWTVKARRDADVCRPCLDNDGHKYDSQAAAYADYPGGKGYVKCLGAANCRCTVVERTDS